MRTVAILVLAGSITWTASSFAQASSSAQESRHASVPDLRGYWNHSPMEPFGDPPSGPGPVNNLMQGMGRGIWHGDHENPILQPWASEVVRHQAEMERAETPLLTSQQECKPSGVPNIHQLPDTVQIVQAPNHVAILYARDHQVRIVHLNTSHADDIEPDWYGDSIGHYEGDTLVVDTIGLNDKTWTDRMGTPHTEQLHVVERYRIINDGRTLRADFMVEDPGAFTMPWSAHMDYDRSPRDGMDEQACSENPRDTLLGTEYPIPKDERYAPQFD